MGQLVYGTDEVILPDDSTGKHTGFFKYTVGADDLYLAVSIPVDETAKTLLTSLNADAEVASVNAVAEAAHLFLYNGTTWDRARGDTTNGLDVDVTRVALHANRVVATAVSSATSVALSCEGVGSVAFDVGTGFANATIMQFEATIDDTNWFNVPVVFNTGQMGTSFTVVTNLPIRGHFLGTGWSQVRIRVSSYVSGTSTISLEGSATGHGTAHGVTGVTADDSPDVGTYPVKMGGVYRVAPATHTNGDIAEFLTDSKGQQRMVLYSDGGNTAVTDAVPADGRINANMRGLDVNAMLTAWNGTSVDRIKGNRLQTGTTGTRSSVSTAITDTLLLAANTARIRATIVNDSTQILLVGDGTTAVSATSYSHKLYPGEEYECNDHTAQIRGIWLGADASGAARVTEIA